jgi:hypothetical protein
MKLSVFNKARLNQARLTKASLSKSACVLAACLGTTLALTGCEAPERYVYRSEATLPATVSLVDAINGENLLTVDVEPGKQLILQFKEVASAAEAQGKDELQWIVTKWGESSVTGANRMTVPPPSARRIEVKYREPERMPTN